MKGQVCIAMDFLSSLIISLLVVIVSSATIWVLKNIRDQLYLVVRYSIAILFRTTYVLIWNDDDIVHSKALSNRLKLHFPSLVFKPIDSPRELLRYPINPIIIKSVILIVSDVTKLSEDNRIKDIIQRRLIQYISRGGGLLGTHDIIYSRVRNDRLEKAFECKLDEFRRINGKVFYQKNPTFQNHVLAQELPDNFELDDGEIVWGHWSKDVNFIFSVAGETTPLVVAKEYASGKLVWLNSGDKKDCLPPSIALPERGFVILLRNSISWFTGLKPKRVNMKNTLIIAHRGIPALVRENTIDSFSKAIEVGADMIEFDVRKTRDGTLIIHHDEVIAGHAFRDISFAEAKKFADEIGYSIPTFEEALKLTTRTIKLDIELKEEGYETEIIEVLQKYFTPDQFVITSFNDLSLAKIKASFPQVTTGLLLGKDKPSDLIRTRLSELFPMKRAEKAHVDFLAPHFRLLRFGFISRAQKHNMRVFVWTVNDESKIKKYILDPRIAAVITNNAEVAITIRNQV